MTTPQRTIDQHVPTVHPVALEFLRWVAVRPRTYDETMDAWRTSCPRLSVWEDCVIDGLVRVESACVILTPPGRSIVDAAARV